MNLHLFSPPHAIPHNHQCTALLPQYPDIPEHVYPHMFRRTRATGLYRDGVDLAIVSRFLGHAQLETTRIYATPSVEMMRAAIAKMPSGSPNEEALWDTDADAVIAKLCGLR
ncbi:MAG: tyrosine-type recombinase/integrase [Lachnospiraceae bacterium]|nr:tyrosine-type recombinase/integrase [Lachnospiraceae bacterium]